MIYICGPIITAQIVTVQGANKRTMALIQPITPSCVKVDLFDPIWSVLIVPALVSLDSTFKWTQRNGLNHLEENQLRQIG